MSISDWSSDVCSSDLVSAADAAGRGIERALARAVLSGKLGFEDLKRLALSVMNDIARSAISGGIGALFGGGGGLVSVGQGVALSLLGAPGRATGEIGRASCRERGCQYV